MKNKDQLSSDNDENGELSISEISEFNFFAILAIRLI